MTPAHNPLAAAELSAARKSLKNAIFWARRAYPPGEYFDSRGTPVVPGRLTWREAESLDGEFAAARAAAVAHLATLTRDTTSAACARSDFRLAEQLAAIPDAPLAIRVYAQAWYLSVLRHDGRSKAGKIATVRAGSRAERDDPPPPVKRDWSEGILVPIYVPPVGVEGQPMTPAEAMGYFVGEWWVHLAGVGWTRTPGLYDASVLGFGDVLLPAGSAPPEHTYFEAHDRPAIERRAVWVGAYPQRVLHWPGGSVGRGQRATPPVWSRPEGPVGRLHPWDGIVFGD